MGNTLKGLKRAGLIALTLVAVTCVTLPVQAGDIMFTTSEKDGSKNLGRWWHDRSQGPVTLKVKNTLAAEHGFAIDSMKVKEVI